MGALVNYLDDDDDHAPFHVNIGEVSSLLLYCPTYEF